MNWSLYFQTIDKNTVSKYEKSGIESTVRFGSVSRSGPTPNVSDRRHRVDYGVLKLHLFLFEKIKDKDKIQAENKISSRLQAL